MIHGKSERTNSVRGCGRSTGERPVFRSLLRGAGLRCPACGNGSMFWRYLKVVDDCPRCGEALHHHRADDAPPFFTIFIVGHIVVSLVLSVEMAYRPALWVHGALWLPLTVILSLALPAACERRAGGPAMGAAHASLRPQWRGGDDRGVQSPPRGQAGLRLFRRLDFPLLPSRFRAPE